MLRSIVARREKRYRSDFTLQSGATARCALADPLGFMHNALCVSWEGWTSDREHRVPFRISNGSSSLSLPPPPLLLAKFSRFQSPRWKQPTTLEWPFPACGLRTKEEEEEAEEGALPQHVVSLFPTLFTSLSSLPLYLAFKSL